MPYFEPHETPESTARAQRRLRQHTLYVLNRERFVELYPEQAAIAREFVRTHPGICEYRFVSAHVSGLKGVEGPVEFTIGLESPTRRLSMVLLQNDQAEWVPSIEADCELQPWERRG